MKSLIRFLPVLCVLLTISVFVSADAPPFAILTQVRGDVKLSYGSGEPQPVSAGQTLQEGFTLQTGGDGRATVVFRDGNLRIVPKNATWSMTTDQAPDGSVATRTGKLLSHVLADAGAAFQHDTITGLRAAQRKKAEAKANRVLRQDASSRPGGRLEKDLSYMDEIRPEPAPAPPAEAGGGNFRLQSAPQAEGVIMEERESRPRPAPTMATSSKPAESDATGVAHAGWLPSATGRLSRKIGGFRKVSPPSDQDMIAVRTATPPPNPSQLPVTGGFCSTSDPESLTRLQEKVSWFPFTRRVAIDFETVEWRPLHFLSDTEETELAAALAELEQLPAETDAETREWLKARVLLYYGLEAEAWFTLRSLLPEEDERPLPHIRGPLEELERKAREGQNSDR